MKESDLPNPSESVTDWINSRVATKTDLTALSVACQVLVTNLFEEMDVMASEVTTIGIPKVKGVIADLDIQLGEAKSQATITDYSEGDHTASAQLSECLGKMNDLSRARTNLEAVRARLVEEIQMNS
jgi:hypothetical protein